MSKRTYKAWAVVNRVRRPLFIRLDEATAGNLCRPSKGERVVPCTVTVGEKKERKK